MKIAFILVHYHTPDILATSVKAIRTDLAATGFDSDIIVVDNGSLPQDQELLNSLEVNLIDPKENLGYAGGVNLGVENTDADIFFLMNPDIEILPGCIKALVDVIEQGAAAAGPRFYLDKEQTILHPPLMDMNIKNEIIWRMAALGNNFAHMVRNRWRKEAREYWTSKKSFESYCLTGALLAISRHGWESIGKFDEIYKLYFDEADWLKRLEKSKLKAYYVPSAGAIHTYNQSAGKEPQAKIWFQESNEIFRKRHYGKLFNYFLKTMVPFLRKIARLNNSQTQSDTFPSTGLPQVNISSFCKIRNTPVWIEMSENDLGIPAAAIPIFDDSVKVWKFPKDVWNNLESKTYHLRAVDSIGNEILHFTYAHSPAI